MGFAWNRLLLYGTGGAAFTELELDLRGVTTDTFRTRVFTASHDRPKAGWTIGGGAEWALSHNLSAGIEYRHCGFGKEVLATHIGSPFQTSFTDVDFASDQVVAKINYRFWEFGRR